MNGTDGGGLVAGAETENLSRSRLADRSIPAVSADLLERLQEDSWQHGAPDWYAPGAAASPGAQPLPSSHTPPPPPLLDSDRRMMLGTTTLAVYPTNISNSSLDSSDGANATIFEWEETAAAAAVELDGINRPPLLWSYPCPDATCSVFSAKTERALPQTKNLPETLYRFLGPQRDYVDPFIPDQCDRNPSCRALVAELASQNIPVPDFCCPAVVWPVKRVQTGMGQAHDASSYQVGADLFATPKAGQLADLGRLFNGLAMVVVSENHNCAN